MCRAGRSQARAGIRAAPARRATAPAPPRGSPAARRRRRRTRPAPPPAPSPAGRARPRSSSRPPASRVWSRGVVARRALVVLAVALGAIAAAPAAAAPIRFETPSVVDPIHTFGEPDVGVDSKDRVFVSGPTGTGTQRSVWFGSVDGGHSFRPISPGPVPTAMQSFNAPPGGGDTDIAFDRAGHQFFTDLYALICLRSARTDDGGAHTTQSVFPGGCAGLVGADRQWLAVYDPPPGTPKQSPYTGPTPLVYQTFADESGSGAEWTKSTDGLNYEPAEQDESGPFGPDSYPAIDQQTGKVFQAAGAQDADNTTFDLLLNIGTPD